MKALHRGAPLEAARVITVLLHGRGAGARGILELSDALAAPGVAFLVPEAPGGSWYPQRFLEPTAKNQPFLDAALEMVRNTVLQAGVPQSQVVLIGFSQGACLALEAAHRTGGRWGAVIGFSGGLIGAEEEVGARQGAGLEGTPVFLGCSDVDSHIPLGRVQRSADVLERQGATVDTRIYPGFGHAINADELEAARALLNAMPKP